MNQEIKKAAVIITSFNLPDLTDRLVEQIQKNIQFPHRLFVFDNGSEDGKISKYTTHRVKKNIGLSRAIDHIYNIAKIDKGVDAYWFLCNDVILDENVDYLEEMAKFYKEISRRYKVACITPSVYPSNQFPIGPYMKRHFGNYFRPILYAEWDALLLTRDFMDKFYPNGFNLGTYHAGINVDLTFKAWKNGYGCFILDTISFTEPMNQTFINYGGKEVNGIFVPALEDLGNILMKDLNILFDNYKKRGLDFIKERNKMHKDIDRRGNFEKYLVGDAVQEDYFDKINDAIIYFFYDLADKFRYLISLIKKGEYKYLINLIKKKIIKI